MRASECCRDRCKTCELQRRLRTVPRTPFGMLRRACRDALMPFKCRLACTHEDHALSAPKVWSINSLSVRSIPEWNAERPRLPLLSFLGAMLHV